MLTPKVLRLGMTYLYSLPFWQQSQRVLEELSTRIKQSCAISVLDEDDIVYVQRFHAKRILHSARPSAAAFPPIPYRWDACCWAGCLTRRLCITYAARNCGR